MRNVNIRGGDRTANSGALANALQVTTVAGAKLYSALAYNASGGIIYLQAHDSASAPADTAVPKLVVQIPVGATGGFDFVNAKIFTNGIYLCSSTTAATKTLGGATDALIDATYQLN